MIKTKNAGVQKAKYVIQEMSLTESLRDAVEYYRHQRWIQKQLEDQKRALEEKDHALEEKDQIIAEREQTIDAMARERAEDKYNGRDKERIDAIRNMIELGLTKEQVMLWKMGRRTCVSFFEQNPAFCRVSATVTRSK